jgi:hypothetical protein
MRGRLVIGGGGVCGEQRNLKVSSMKLLGSYFDIDQLFHVSETSPLQTSRLGDCRCCGVGVMAILRRGSATSSIPRSLRWPRTRFRYCCKAQYAGLLLLKPQSKPALLSLQRCAAVVGGRQNTRRSVSTITRGRFTSTSSEVFGCMHWPQRCMDPHASRKLKSTSSPPTYGYGCNCIKPSHMLEVMSCSLCKL